MEIISKRLKKLREDVGLSQSKIGQLVGVPQSSIYRYEQGQSVPSPKTFRWYADYFDVSLDYIFGRTDKPQGKLYSYEPQTLKIKAEKQKEMQEFIEMCFDPKTEANAKLKTLMLQMMEEKK